MGISDFVTKQWMYLLGGFLLIYVLFKLYKSSVQGRLAIDKFKLSYNFV